MGFLLWNIVLVIQKILDIWKKIFLKKQNFYFSIEIFFFNFLICSSAKAADNSDGKKL